MSAKCFRCGREFLPGVSRYVMTVTFIADVDYQLPAEGDEGDFDSLLEEMERIPEEELMAQVYEKRVFLICRPCKEHMAAHPFGTTAPASDRIQ